MTDENKTENQTIPSWYIDEGIPGVGDRPTWLNDKFKTAADLAKSYAELERKFSTPPEEYNLSSSKYIDPDYAPFQDLMQYAKQQRVPKPVIDKMVDSFDKYLDEFGIDYEEEAKKLGENGKERITTLENWAKANLSNDSFNALTKHLQSADAIKALEEIRGKMMSNSTMIPAGNDSGSNNVMTIDSLKEELAANIDKYKDDPKYRKELQGRIEMAYKAANGNTGYIDKMGA